MVEFLEAAIDKFVFQVATDRLYSAEGVWVREEGGRVRLGVTDYAQQRGGDAAFVHVKPAGSVLAAGDEVAEVETIKAMVSVASPVAGRVVEVNAALESAPETVNAEPYGRGWLAVVEPANWAADRAGLLDAAGYLAVMTAQARKELDS
jgi:glycine cleavage system H protein